MDPIADVDRRFDDTSRNEGTHTHKMVGIRFDDPGHSQGRLVPSWADGFKFQARLLHPFGVQLHNR